MITRIFYGKADKLWFAENGEYNEDGSFDMHNGGELDSAEQIDYYFAAHEATDTLEFYPAGTYPAGNYSMYENAEG